MISEGIFMSPAFVFQLNIVASHTSSEGNTTQQRDRHCEPRFIAMWVGIGVWQSHLRVRVCLLMLHVGLYISCLRSVSLKIVSISCGRCGSH